MIYRVFCAGTLSHGQGLSVRSTRGVIYRRVAAAARRRGARADRQSSVARSTYGISLSPHNPASPLHTHTWSHERHERGTKAGNNRNQYSYHRYVGREEERTPRRAGPGWDWRRRTLQTYSTLVPSLSTASPPYPDLIPPPFFFPPSTPRKNHQLLLCHCYEQAAATATRPVIILIKDIHRR